MHMQRTMVLALCAWLGGSATAWAYTKLNAWRGFGPDFQLGYVAGYLDGLKIGRATDIRGMYVTTGGRPNLEQWRADVNAFYEDPANAQKSIPDAVNAVAQKRREANMRKQVEKRAATPAPAPSPVAPAVPDSGS